MLKKKKFAHGKYAGYSPEKVLDLYFSISVNTLVKQQVVRRQFEGNERIGAK